MLWGQKEGKKRLRKNEALIWCTQRDSNPRRLDSGVHADNYVANFFTNSAMNLEEMMNYLQEYLPEDIVVKELKMASDRFHSRLNVKGKTYVYSIQNTKYQDVFSKRFSYHVEEELDIESMIEGAKYLIGTHDFKSFTNLKVKKDKKSTIRTIRDIKIINNNGLVQIEVSGNGFLLNMVRIIVGTLVEVGLHKRKPEDIKEILDSKNRENSGLKVPGKGLMLKNLEY
ncbi:tRNA pseudouridine(38-40) synthase TruA [Clostridium paraputrificum]|uniref:tRNA pseudouridine(38-40) synthase TruA n=1 Tax=Clostridium paraputrificum TaxID=29363 RepID=UPI0018A03D0B|nr:tRNA pseudouridine(38-40) synthase TruA [Clostridium paraputrificum]